MKRILAVISLFCLFTLPSAAISAEDLYDSQLRALDADGITDSLPEGARELLEDTEIKPSTNLEGGISDILEHSKGKISDLLGAGFASLGRILCIALLCGLLSNFNNDLGGKVKVPAVRVAGVLVIAVMTFTDIGSLMGKSRQTMEEINVFSKSLLPALAAASAAAGSPTAAVTGQTVAYLCSDALITLITKIFIPFTYIYAALGVVGCAVGQGILDKFAGLIKSAITTALKWSLMLFMAYITLSGVLASAGDSILRRSAKLAISGSVPVVGGVISEAADTILGGALLIKNSIGIFGLVAVLASVFLPALQTGIGYLAFKLAGAVAAPLTEEGITAAINHLSGAYGLIFGMTTASAVLLMISLIAGIMLGGG